MTNDMISRLMSAGLTKQQATSVTAEALVNLFMPDDGKILLREAQGRVKEMEATVASLRKDYYEMKKRIEGVSNTLLSITQAQEQYGVVTDPKAQNIVALYGALMTMNEKKGSRLPNPLLVLGISCMHTSVVRQSGTLATIQ